MNHRNSILATLSLVCALAQTAFAVGPHATSLNQYRADTGAAIPYTTGTVPTGVGVYFEANVTSDEGRTVRMDVELRQLPATFTGIPNYSSSLASSGTRVRTSTATGMAAGNWGWKVRFVDSVGVSTGWLPAGNPDFIVQASSTVPTVQTVAATGPTTTSATINGTITSDGGSAVGERRFDWGTSSGNLNQWTAAVSVSGNNFSYNLSGLTPGTTYYFRAWARNGSTANVGYGAGWNIGSILSFTTSASCSYSVSPSSASPNASSGSGSFNMTAGSGCSWTASTAYSWIHTSSSGSGSGTINYTYDANASTSPRSATITVGGQTFTITQAGASCSYAINPSSASLSASSGSSSFNVTAGSGCSWSASTAYSWIHTTSSGSGNGTVSYSYDANTSTSSRSGTITAGGQAFTITQAGTGGGFSVPITQDLIPVGRDNRPGYALTVNYITIHDTDNTALGANAGMHAIYVKSDAAAAIPASWHFTVDDHEIYQHLPTSENGWHAGDGANGTGNRQSLAIEICMNSDGNRTQAEENAAWLTAKLLTDFNLPLAQVKQHNSWSGKNCPSVLRGRTGGWDGFLARVAYYLGPCSYYVSPASFGPAASSGSGSFNVTVGSGCTWSANTAYSWIHTTSSGNGNGTVNYTYDANVSASSRTGTITVGGQVFTITQAGMSSTPSITSPSPGSALSSSSATFQWSSGTSVAEYFFYVGTSLGANDLYGQSQGLNLSVTINNLPVNGSTLFIRLYWQIAGLWYATDYTYTAATSCSYSLSPTSATPGASSGSGSFGVTAGSGCSWSASTAYSWIQTSSSGSGNGTVSYTIDANASTSSRMGTITAGGQAFTITQVGVPCSYSISPGSANPDASSGSGSFNVTAGSGCSWSANSAYGWIHTTSSGSGNGTVSYTYDVNGSTSSRTGTITVGGETFTITQAGASSTPSITSPLPGATLASSSATFQWSSGTAVTEYFFYVGTSFGTNDIFGQSQALNHNVTVNGLPVNGSTLYVRLWWQIAGVWQYADYTYTASHSLTRIISLSGNLAFGEVAVGMSAQRTLAIANIGNSPLTISSISYPSGFSGNWSSGTIAAGDSHNVTVTFTPIAATVYGGAVTVSSDKTSGGNTFAASGTGTAGTQKHLTSMSISNGVIRFNLNGLVGSNYVLQVSSNLATWIPLLTNVIPAGGSRLIDLPAQTNLSRQYYRALPLFSGPAVLQPGPADGKDIWTTSIYSYAPGGGGPGGGLNDHQLRIGGWADLYYALLQFDLGNQPTNVSAATLYLYCFSQSGGGTSMYLDRITQAWDWRTQGTGSDLERLWWADKPTASLWNVSPLPTPTLGQWYAVDITTLYNAWQNGTHANYGLQFRPVFNNNNNFNTFYSADFADDPTLRPKLVITK